MKMMKMRKSVVAAMMLLGLVVAPVAASISLADDPAPAAQGGGDLVDASGKPVDGGESYKGAFRPDALDIDLADDESKSDEQQQENDAGAKRAAAFFCSHMIPAFHGRRAAPRNE